MKTVCLYFQVHQPWRLKTYRFFHIGKDHNYLDDLTNRAIMLKIARECYLPMNALLLKLIKENGGELPIGDNSSPEKVHALTQMSKKVFKRAVGILLKRGDITAESTQIKLK